MSEIALPRPIEWPRWLSPVLGLGAVLSILLLRATGSSVDVSSGEQSACTTTVAAASASQANVETARDHASVPDCVTVPSGTATWTAFAMPARDFQLLGASTITCTGTAGASDYSCTKGATNTAITAATSNSAIVINLAYNHRVSGFALLAADGAYVIDHTGNQDATKHFRIDHNEIDGDAPTHGDWQPTRIFGGTNAVHPRGIWDHNRVLDGISIHTNGTSSQLNDPGVPDDQHELWAENPGFGEGNDRVYVEANYYSDEGGYTHANFADGNYAARAVLRFNTTDGPSGAGFEFHSVQGDNRGYQRWEMYNNHFVNLDEDDTCFSGMAFLRGGTGFMFDNDMTGLISGCNLTINIDNVRSVDNVAWFNKCDGGVTSTSGIDEDTSGEQGWHCRDQIGVSHDNTQWDFFASADTPLGTLPAYDQAFRPGYLFRNKRGGTLTAADPSTDPLNDTHINANRDFYESGTLAEQTSSSSPFNGTVGVGHGTVANRPTTCTTGVGYWATDEGEWNSDQSGADGRFYRCTATDVWTLDYTPYTYPHPWTVDE